MKELAITQRYARSLSPDGTDPEDVPDWIADIDNPYLHGYFAPILEECEIEELTVVEGAIPEDLCGAYYRNGPNQVHKPKNRYHWFDGDGMVYGVWFKDGKARYRNRWIKTKGYQYEGEEQKAVWPGVLGPFDFSLPYSPIKDTANTDLVFFNRQLIALWYESGEPYTLDPLTLETSGVENVNGQLKWPLSAHSHLDPHSGDLIYFNYAHKPPYMQYGVINKAGEIHHIDVDLPGPRRPHDIGITKNFSILHDFPVFHNEKYFKETGKRIPVFHSDVPTRFGVLPRFGQADELRWFECKPCYMLHTVNCWEEGDWITMIGCINKDPSLKPDPQDGEIAAMISFLQLRVSLYCWRFNLRTGEVLERDLDGMNTEFPMINENYRGVKNSYAYLQDLPHEVPVLFEGIVKYDISNGTILGRYSYGKGVYGTESPFAPRLDSKAEDDGYILTMTTDTNDWRCYCLILDAKDIAAGPVAKLLLPHRISCGFHTRWVPGEWIY